MKKNEQLFLGQLKKSFAPVGGFWFKIPDAPTNIQVAKPYDVSYLLRGVQLGIEGKYYPSKQTPPISTIIKQLRPSQIDGLSLNYVCGGLSLVVVQTGAAEGHWYKAFVDAKGFSLSYLSPTTKISSTWTIPHSLLELVEETRRRNTCRYDDIVVPINETREEEYDF